MKKAKTLRKLFHVISWVMTIFLFVAIIIGGVGGTFVSMPVILDQIELQNNAREVDTHSSLSNVFYFTFVGIIPICYLIFGIVLTAIVGGGFWTTCQKLRSDFDNDYFKHIESLKVKEYKSHY